MIFSQSNDEVFGRSYRYLFVYYPNNTSGGKDTLGGDWTEFNRRPNSKFTNFILELIY